MDLLNMPWGVRRTGIDGFVLGHCVRYKEDQKPLEGDTYWQKFGLDAIKKIA